MPSPLTDYQAKYYAHELQRSYANDHVGKLAGIMVLNLTLVNVLGWAITGALLFAGCAGAEDTDSMDTRTPQQAAAEFLPQVEQAIAPRGLKTVLVHDKRALLVHGLQFGAWFAAT